MRQKSEGVPRISAAVYFSVGNTPCGNMALHWVIISIRVRVHFRHGISDVEPALKLCLISAPSVWIFRHELFNVAADLDAFPPHFNEANLRLGCPTWNPHWFGVKEMIGHYFTFRNIICYGDWLIRKTPVHMPHYRAASISQRVAPAPAGSCITQTADHITDRHIILHVPWRDKVRPAASSVISSDISPPIYDARCR